MYEENNDFYTQELAREQNSFAVPLETYVAKTFLWMLLGLLTTFVVAVALGSSRVALRFLFSVPYFPIVLLVAELGVVLVLSSRVQKLSVATAQTLFFVYAALNGVFFSVYLFIFDLSSLVFIFLATAVFFGGMALYGYLTRTDLSRLRPLLLGGLFFLIVVGIISLFVPFRGAMERVYCLIGIAVFLAFTAYDTQKIRAYHAATLNDPAMAAKGSICAALELYLDFINLFIYLLRLLGKRR